MSIYRMRVEINSAGNTFYSLGNEVQFSGNSIFVNDGVITYLDKRTKKFRIYIEIDSVWKYREFEAVSSTTSNFAYSIIDNPILCTGDQWTNTTSPFDDVSSNRDYDPNRVLVSTPYKPRQLYGRNALYIGNSAYDEVLTFRANAAAVSAGQFGQFPLYAFCKNSIWAMEVGTGDVAFSKVSPLLINEGIINKHAVTNIGTTIVYATKYGIKTFPEESVPLSYPIQNTENENDILKNMGDTTRMGYFSDKATGRKELWIAVDKFIYAYSLVLKRWFTLSYEKFNNKIVSVKAFVDVGGELVGIYGDIMYKEAGSSKRVGYFQTAPIYFGNMEVLKKFRRILLRNGGSEYGYEVLATNHTDYDFTLSDFGIHKPLYIYDENGNKIALYNADNSGVEHTIYAIDVEYEERYTHRMRIRTKEIDLGFYGGYGGIYSQLYADTAG